MFQTLSDESASFFAPDDERDLAEKVLGIISDSKIATLLATRARSIAEEYSWKKRAASILKELGERI